MSAAQQRELQGLQMPCLRLCMALLVAVLPCRCGRGQAATAMLELLNQPFSFECLHIAAYHHCTGRAAMQSSKLKIHSR